MSKPISDSTILTRALALLRAGLLASALPGRLIYEFGISAERAGKLAGLAIERREGTR